MLARVCQIFDKWKALHRIISLIAAATLTKVFLEEAIDRTVDWTDYFAYSGSMAMCYSPTLASKALDVIARVKGVKQEVKPNKRKET
jgi:hypothetical protein